MRTSAVVRGRFVSSVAGLIVAMCVGSGAAAADTTFAPGGSLQDALVALQEQGIKVVYSSRVVGPELTVRETTGAGDPRVVLSSLLAPHGLVAEPAPIGWFVVKRADSNVPPGGGASTPGDGGGAASSGSPLLRVEEELTVNPLIWIPVHVLRDGRPARGLEVDDFEVFLRRRSVPIVGFRVLDHARPLEGETRFASGPAGTSPSRRFVFFLDLIDAPVLSLRRARQVAFEILESTLEPGDLGLVAAYSPVQGFRLLQEFTPDRSRLRAAIRLGTHGPGELSAGDERTADTDRSGVSEATFVGTSAGQKSSRQTHDDELAPPDPASDSRVTSSLIMPPNEEKDLLQHTVGLLEWIETVGTVATTVPGSTHLLLLSPGFDTTSITGLAGDTGTDRGRLHRINLAAAEGELWSVDSELRFGSSWALRRYRRCVDRLRERGCRVHGLHTGFGPPRGGAGLARDAGLAWLARQTGGTFSSDPEQFPADLGVALERHSVSYLLGIPADADEPRRARKLRVKLARSEPGLVISHPARLPQPRTEGLVGAERTLMAMEAVISHPDGGTFESELRVAATTSQGPPDRRLQIFLDAPSLLAVAASKPVLTLDVWAYAASSSGEWTQLARRRFSLDLDEVTPSQLGEVLRIEEPFELPPDDYVVRALVQNVDTGASSLRSASLVLPPSAGRD